jgi:hypothetical protein
MFGFWVPQCVCVCATCVCATCVCAKCVCATCVCGCAASMQHMSMVNVQSLV